MRIAFYAPFKPLDHPNPSGDLVIATGLVGHLRQQGNDVQPVSRLRARWIYWKPWNMVRALVERRRLGKKLAREKPDLWLTYHSYYKAPDMIGPFVAKKLNIPYVIFQGIYSTRVRKKWQTRPGYELNIQALKAADMVLTQGHKSRSMTLKDYSISFGDLSVDTDVVNSHLDKAYMAAKRGKKDIAVNEVKAAREAITFELNGDQIGEA